MTRKQVGVHYKIPKNFKKSFVLESSFFSISISICSNFDNFHLLFDHICGSNSVIFKIFADIESSRHLLCNPFMKIALFM